MVLIDELDVVEFSDGPKGSVSRLFCIMYRVFFAHSRKIGPNDVMLGKMPVTNVYFFEGHVPCSGNHFSFVKR